MKILLPSPFKILTFAEQLSTSHYIIDSNVKTTAKSTTRIGDSKKKKKKKSILRGLIDCSFLL